MSQIAVLKDVGGSGGVVVTLSGNSGGAVPSDGSGNIVVQGGAGINISGNPLTNTLTVVNTGAGFTWTPVTSATNPNLLVSENGYIAKGAGAVNFVLPAAANIGDTFKVVGYGNLWTLGQNALQTITLGAQTTTPGIGGSVAATNIKDILEILCVTTNLEFEIVSSVGNLTII